MFSSLTKAFNPQEWGVKRCLLAAGGLTLTALAAYKIYDWMKSEDTVYAESPAGESSVDISAGESSVDISVEESSVDISAGKSSVDSPSLANVADNSSLSHLIASVPKRSVDSPSATIATSDGQTATGSTPLSSTFTSEDTSEELSSPARMNASTSYMEETSTSSSFSTSSDDTTSNTAQCLRSYQKALEYKNMGNEAYKKKDLAKAEQLYLKMLEYSPPEATKLKATAYHNLAAIALEIKAWKAAEHRCNMALRLNPSYENALNKRDKARHQLQLEMDVRPH